MFYLFVMNLSELVSIKSTAVLILSWVVSMLYLSVINLFEVVSIKSVTVLWFS